MAASGPREPTNAVFKRHFLGVPLAETSPHLEVNVSYLLPKKLRNLKKKEKLKKTQENKKRDTLKGFNML